jgi:beta-aspartyl-dipeptidase (metallo-type)
MNSDYTENGRPALITIIANGEVYAPEPLGRRDILVVGREVALLGDARDWPFPPGVPARVLDAGGALVLPGFVDGHVHIAGGGGEGGFATRTPEIMLSSLVRAGITTVIGCLGTDSVTRSPDALYAKARALEEEGITAFVLTGAYRVPTATFTGDVMRDLLLIDRVVGVGEVAVSDHRSAQPTVAELRRLVADARVGGILSGKAGVVNLHLGDGQSGLGPVRELLEGTELPWTQVLPTHVNRNERLFAEAVAYARAGGCIDLTACASARPEPGELTAAVALRRCLDADVAPDRITLTSDGQGSLPVFDARGELERLDVGRAASVVREMRDAVLDQGVPLPLALATLTRNPAARYKLKGKGRIAPGADADLVLADPATLEVRTVLAKGRVLMEDGRLLATGTFE